MHDTAEKPFNGVAALLKLVSPHKWALLVVVLCLVVLAGLNMAMPKLLGYVIDNVFPTGEQAAADIYGERKPIPVRYAGEAITIDGNFADWKAVSPMPALYEGLMASSVRITWREDGLYILVRPVDRALEVEPERPEEGDSLALYIQKDAVREVRLTGASACYVVAPQPHSQEGECIVRVKHDNVRVEPVPEIQARWGRPLQGQWGMEIFIPAERLRPADFAEGGRMLMNWVLNDDGKAVQRFFADDQEDQSERSPDTWAPIVLERQPRKIPAGTVHDPLEIMRAPDTITVDGDAGDWAGVPSMPLPYEGTRESYVRLAWGEEGIYGLVSPPDEEITANLEHPWQADSFELFLQKDARATPAKTENTTQYTFSPVPNQPGRGHVKIPYGRDEEIYGDPGIECIWQPTDEGYNLEFMIPARVLDPAEMAVNTNVRMNFAVNNAGVAVQQLYTEKTIAEGWQVPQDWAVVRLRRHLTLSSEAAARFRLLLGVMAALLGIYVLRNITYYLARRRILTIGEYTAFGLRQRLIGHLHRLSVDFYQQNKPGKLSSRVMNDVQSVQAFIQEELAQIILNTLMLFVAAGIMFSLDWFLALVTLAIMPLHVLVYVFFRRPIAVYAREAKEHIANVSGDLIEQFHGAPVVKASATSEREEERFRRSMRRGMRAQIQQNKYYLLQKVAADLLVGVGIIILFGVGGYSVMYRGMSAGDFVAFYAYIGLLYPLLLKLVSQAGKFTRTATSLERVDDIVHLVPGVREHEDAIDHHIAAGRIEFQNVYFGYRSNGSVTPVLRDVSFTIEPGEHVLVTGMSGAGKSTLVNLIPRFYDPDDGCIRIDGMDLRRFTLDSLRRQIGFVFQDVFLFNDTVMQNVRYAAPEADDEAVREACRKAHAHEFIQGLSDGYMTVIGEGGVQLSQGEKRRVMIARAILKDPKILIMDEPLVSLDAETKGHALDGLAALISHRTVLTITHYPEELPRADRRIEIDDGQVTVSEPEQMSDR